MLHQLLFLSNHHHFDMYTLVPYIFWKNSDNTIYIIFFGGVTHLQKVKKQSGHWDLPSSSYGSQKKLCPHAALGHVTPSSSMEISRSVAFRWYSLYDDCPMIWKWWTSFTTPEIWFTCFDLKIFLKTYDYNLDRRMK